MPTPPRLLALAVTGLLAVVACATAPSSRPAAPARTDRGAAAPTSTPSPTPPTASDRTSAPPQRPAPPAADDRRIIVPEARAPAFSAQFGHKPDGWWTPEPAQIDALEAALGPHLRRTPPQFSSGLAGKFEAKRYRAQYIGLIEDGARLIFGNYFCDHNETDWRSEPVAVDDGGDCYFQLRYAPASGRFTDVAINNAA